jgi:uncharacterized membrane-anchored protein YitT (DUF2179 family)
MIDRTKHNLSLIFIGAFILACAVTAVLAAAAWYTGAFNG